MGYGNYNTCTCFHKCIWWRLSSTFMAVSLSALMQHSFSKLFKRSQCKINISLLLMQHIYISFALNPWYIYVAPFPSRSFVRPHTVLYKCVDMFPMIRVLVWKSRWSYFSSVSRPSDMAFGWYSERELWNGHSSYVCHPVYRAVKFETYLICIVFCDPTPAYSNFHIVPGPSLEYNAAIFIECYSRIKKWNYLTKSSL